jgi:hypothetical protein
MGFVGSCEIRTRGRDTVMRDRGFSAASGVGGVVGTLSTYGPNEVREQACQYKACSSHHQHEGRHLSAILICC